MKDKIRKAILEIVGINWRDCDLKLEEIEINRAPEKFGDYSTNVAMKLAGKPSSQGGPTSGRRESPMEIAEKIKEELETEKPPQSPFKKRGGRENEDISENLSAQDWIEKVEVVKPGFINFYFNQKAFENVLKDVLKEGDRYGFLDLKKGKKVMVEFGQPNTHKAITVGHLKSAISGLAMVKIFENLGAEVIRANFFGDVGMHVAKSTWGMMQKEIPADFDDWDSVEKMKFIDKSYVEGARAFEEDPEAEKEIRKINRDIYKKEDNENYQWYQKIRDWSIEHQNSFFNEIGIEYDRQYPESEIYQEAVEIVNQYGDKIFTESQGAVIYEGEKEGLNNWVFLTSEGNPTYSAKDLALANKKFEEYDLDLAIVTTSVEQTDYFKAIIKVLEKIDQKFVGKYKHIPFGWLLMDGKKTSSRMGKTAKAMDILKEAKELAEKQIASDKEYSSEERRGIVEKVALGGLKFMILSREFHKDINYDPEEFIKLNGFSGPFIMYSYVRINSIIKKFDFKEDNLNWSELKFENKHEKQLASTLMMYKDTVARVGEEIAPHLMCVYLYEVAQKFNGFYENCPIQGAENEIQKKSRLVLAKATGQVLRNGLGLLGIEVLEKM